MHSAMTIATSQPLPHGDRPQPGRALPGARKAPRATCVALASLALSAFGALPGAASAQSGEAAPSPTSATTLSVPLPAAPTVTAPKAKAVRVTTSMGVFVIELLPDRAPLTVQNFLRYVNEGFYSNTLFHRVVGNFVAQGGGHDAASLKLKATHEYIVNESGNGLQNKRGTVGMARSGGAHTANSQFYINLADNNELDPLPTRWGYTVFGRVIEGMDVIDKMGVVATGNMGGDLKADAPLKPIVIEKVEALAAAPVAAPAPASPVTPPPPPPSAAEAPPAQ
jgi:cyclophilin family peptidyl-prolyl cis-trans isomerase